MNRYLGSIPHLSIGVRLPDIVIPPILKAFKDTDSVGGLMLSYNRETAPSSVISSTNTKLLLRGHTGTSIAEYISKAREYIELYDIPMEIEADHVSLMASPERAIKRITGAEFEYGLSDKEIKESLTYIEEELKEAARVGGVDFITIDTCELVDLSVDRLDSKKVIELYESQFDSEERKRLEREYCSREFTFIDNGMILRLRFKRDTIARLALKFLKSIKYVKVIYDLALHYIERPFGVEVSLDEIPLVTKPEELLFYLNELHCIGVYPDFIAPNIGFKKREDYDGDLEKLKRIVKTLHMVAKSYGTLLSLHSGSGAHPYSDKGVGTWSTIREATNGMVKYKVSGVYIQLLLEIMSRFPQGSKPRRLYEEIFDTIYNYLREEVKRKTLLYSPALEKALDTYDERVRREASIKYDPRVDFFRHYFFIFQAVRDSRGRRYLRSRVLELYSENDDLRRVYEKEAYDLTRRILVKLGLDRNILKYKMVSYTV